MMNQITTLGMAVAVMLSSALGADAQQNRLPDADFAETIEVMANQGEEAQRHGPDTPWKWYVIEADAKVTYTDGSVEASGGKVFLHSAEFEVEPGQSYEVSFTAAGDGKVSVGFLWWQYDDNGARGWADPHWARLEEPVNAGSDEPAEVSSTFEAPENANATYLRLVVTDGTVVVRNLQVTPTTK